MKLTEHLEMNIGLFSESYLPQVEGVVTALRNLRDGLCRKGHSVYIFTISHPGATPEDGVFRFRSVRTPFDPGHRLALHPSIKRIKAIAELNLDIVHTQDLFTMGNLGARVSEILKVPQVHTFNSNYFVLADYLGIARSFGKLYARHKIRAFCNKQRRVIAPSKKARDILLDCGVSQPIEIIAHGADLEPFRNTQPDFCQSIRSFRENHGIAEDDSVILSLGRIAKEKQPLVIVDNFISVLKVFPKAILLFVGDGPQRKKVEKYVSRQGVGNRVRFVGTLDYPNSVAVAYRASDVFVSTSVTEIFSFSVLEAIASGLPVVAAKDPCLEERVVEGKNGFFFDDPHELWRGLNKILGDQNLKKNMSRFSVEISRLYDLSHYVDKITGAYTLSVIGPGESFYTSQ